MSRKDRRPTSIGLPWLRDIRNMACVTVSHRSARCLEHPVRHRVPCARVDGGECQGRDVGDRHRSV